MTELLHYEQVDTAINHFIEAGCSNKAIESAIASRQWTKAVQIVDAPDVKVENPPIKIMSVRHLRDWMFTEGGGPTPCRLRCRFAKDWLVISKQPSSTLRRRSFLCGLSWQVRQWKCIFVPINGKLCRRWPHITCQSQKRLLCTSNERES